VTTLPQLLSRDDGKASTNVTVPLNPWGLPGNAASVSTGTRQSVDAGFPSI